MKEDLLKIINNYGIDHQIKHWFTEIFELVEAIEKDDGSLENKKKITSELADNYNFLGQFQVFFEITDIEVKMEQQFKNERQLERIEKENANNSKINNTIEYIESIREYFEEGLQPEFDNIIKKLRGE